MSLGYPNWVKIEKGPSQGCSKLDWGDQWGASIGILFIVYLVLIPGAVTLTYKGWNVVGMVLYPLLFILGISILGVPWCGVDAVMTGATIQMIANIVFAGLFLLCAVINHSPVSLKRFSPVSALMHKRIGKPVNAPWANTDLFLVGPLNEFFSLSAMELIGTIVVLFWLAICVWARYRDLMDPVWGFENLIGNKSRAFGRAMSAATLRCLLLTFVSSSRNTIINYFLGIPFERAMKWHKALGRLQMTCMWIHMAAMLAGGTEVGYAWYTKNHNMPVQVEWKNTLNLYGSGTNLFAGPIALFFWTLLVVMSLPYFRRQMLETFYFTHINLFFVANIFTVFHARAQVVPYLVPAALLFYIDASIRFMAKITAVQALEIKVVGENMVKLVLRQNGFPLAAFKYHAGSYIWLSCNLRKKVVAEGEGGGGGGGGEEGGNSSTSKPAAAASVELSSTNAKYDIVPVTDELPSSEASAPAAAPAAVQQIELDGIFNSIKVPGGPPSGLPSWIWFHPITISDMDESGAITLYIKSFGEGVAQWSGQLLAAAKLVESGALTLEDIGFHIGGPNGSLMIKEPLEDLGHIVLASGGIGVTPMVAILSDLCKKKYSGKVDFVWSTRSSSEIECFRPLFEQCAQFEKMNIQVFFTGKVDAENAALPVASKGFTIATGRPSLPSLVTIDDGSDVGILCCGPEALMVASEEFAVDLQRQGKSRVLFHRETFEF